MPNGNAIFIVKYSFGWVVDITNANLIYPGQVLRVNGVAGRSYTVRYGDTLSGIVSAHGTTWQALAQKNGIGNPNWIYPGQTLTI